MFNPDQPPSTGEGNIKPEQEISPEISQQRKINRIASLLELAEEGVEEKYTIANSAVDDLLNEIEKVRSEGIDLSPTENFDNRIEQLESRAPLTEVNSCLEKAQNFRGQEDKLPLASWYWEAREKLNTYKDKIKKEELEDLQKVLNEIEKELGM